MKKTICILISISIFTLFLASPLMAQSVQDIDESTLLLDTGEAQPADDQAGGEDPAVDEGVQPFSGVTFWDFLRMILILGAIIGVIYLLFRIMKKRGSPKLQNNELFNVISTQVISSNKSIHLVQVGNQFFLIGAGDQAVNLISEIEDKETVDEIRLKLSNLKISGKKTFKNIFSGLFGQGSVRLDGSVNQDTSFMKKQRDKLRRM